VHVSKDPNTPLIDANRQKKSFYRIRKSFDKTCDQIACAYFYHRFSTLTRKKEDVPKANSTQRRTAVIDLLI
jgi:hypothetical protein